MRNLEQEGNQGRPPVALNTEESGAGEVHGTDNPVAMKFFVGSTPTPP